MCVRKAKCTHQFFCRVRFMFSSVGAVASGFFFFSGPPMQWQCFDVVSTCLDVSGVGVLLPFPLVHSMTQLSLVSRVSGA